MAYNKALRFFNEQDYGSAIEILEKKSETNAKYKELMQACFNKLDEITYNRALHFFNKQEYAEAILALKDKAKIPEFKELLDKAAQNFIELSCNNILKYKNEKRYFELKKTIDEIEKYDLNIKHQKLYDLIQEAKEVMEKEAEKLYEVAIEYINKDDFEKALEFANNACQLNNSSANMELAKNISLYQSALEHYYNQRFDYAKAAINSCKQFKGKLQELINELQEKLIDGYESLSIEYYNEALESLAREDFKEARSLASKAFGLKMNTVTSELLNRVQYEEAEYNYNKANAIVEQKEQGTLKEAQNYINKAIELNYGNSSYNTLLETIEHLIYNKSDISNNTHSHDNSIVVANVKSIEKTNNKPKPITLENATKNELLAIDGFDNEKADKFIQERENGKKYYNIETFAADFELQPHQIIMLEDKLIFSQKPVSKIGRKVDL